MAHFLSDKIRLSLNAYKGEFYSEINSSLRESSFDDIDPDIKRHIENIDSVMKKGQGAPITVYRGINNIHSFINNESGSPILVDLAFCSVTRKLSVTHNFVNNKGCCVVQFILPNEIKRYDYEDVHNEGEILLQRNTQLIFDNIDNYQKVGNLMIYTAVIKTYEPPRITKKDIDSIHKLQDEMDNIDLNKKYAEEWSEDLKQYCEDFVETLTFKHIKDDINMRKKFIENNKLSKEIIQKNMCEILNVECLSFSLKRKISKRVSRKK